MSKPGKDKGERVSEEIKEDLIKRLRRIEGQIRGLQRMLEEDRSCQEIVVQVSAVKSAVVQVAMIALSHQLATCLCQEMAESGSPDLAVARFMEAFKKFY